MNLEGRRILVIGGGGLIGSHVVEELLREPVKEVLIYDNFCRGRIENLEIAVKDPRMKINEAGGDILQTDVLARAMKGIDGVVHLAALWLLQCHEFPRAAFDVNVAGTFNVMEAARDAGVQRVVWSSSASVYGDAVEVPMTEDHPYRNTTFYGATKIAGEHMFRAFYHRYGLKYVGLRYMNVYGPRQDYKGAYVAVAMKILDRIDQGLRPIVYGDGSQSYDFIHVRDAARANVCALQADTADRFYNVGMGTRTTIKQLCELLLELTGSRQSIQYEPAGPTFVTHRVGCPERAKKELGFAATTPLREGLESLIAWRKDHQERTALAGAAR